MWSKEEWVPATRVGPRIPLTGNKLNFGMEKTQCKEALCKTYCVRVVHSCKAAGLRTSTKLQGLIGQGNLSSIIFCFMFYSTDLYSFFPLIIYF